MKGYTYIKGVDYHDTFSPIAKLTTIHILLVVVTPYNWPFNQIDINNAFLFGFLNEKNYMRPPSGYSEATPSQVCHLKKSLYGLKQASWQWNIGISQFLIARGFHQSSSDYSLFTKYSSTVFRMVLLYDGDMLIFRNDLDLITSYKRDLDVAFTIKDLGNVCFFFLGWTFVT